MKTLFAFAGNARTFLECIDNIYENVISKMVSAEDTTYLYFYMKLTSPSKNQFQYPPVNRDDVIRKLTELESKGFHVSSTLLDGDEVSDEALLSTVARRSMYTVQLSDSGLARAMQCHYNLHRVGEWISESQISFDRVVYIRPDLYFNKPAMPLHTYSSTKVTLALNIDSDTYPSDFIAIIPKHRIWDFFRTPMHIYQTNVCQHFFRPEEILWAAATPYEARRVGYCDIRRA